MEHVYFGAVLNASNEKEDKMKNWIGFIGGLCLGSAIGVTVIPQWRNPSIILFLLTVGMLLVWKVYYDFGKETTHEET